MNTVDDATGMDPRVKAELQEACDRLAKGIPSSADDKREAIARLNELREEIRARSGVQNSAVDLVRQTREAR